MKRLFSLLLTIVLCAAALPAGALEMTELPATFAELQAMLPEMPSLVPEGLAFYVPTYEEVMSKSRGFEFLCDKEAWVAGPGRVGGMATIDFFYDDTTGAYVTDDRGYQGLTFGITTGMMDGIFTIASTQIVNDWKLNVAFYFDNDFSESVLFRDSDPITEATWLNVAATGDVNYFMPNVVAQYPLDNGSLQVWLYATKTIVVIRDPSGATLVSQTYPEYSEWCSSFMPTLQ